MQVVCARAEEHGRGEGREAYGTAVAQALALPPVALEWCLPLVREGGRVVLLAGAVDLEQAAAAAAAVGRRPARGRPAPGLRAPLAPRRAEGRADARAVPAPARRSPETSSRLTSIGLVGKVFALANQKGGVGKTTTAVNVAACLAEAGASTLVVDLDPQANATSGLGERANGTSTYDLLDGAPLDELAHETAVPNLYLVPSRPELAGAAVELARRDDGETFLPEALAPARDRYDFVFIDCPPSLGPLTVNALAATDRVLVPVQCEYYALEGLAQLLHSIELVRARLNPKLALAGMILTMVDGRTRLAADVAAEVRRPLRRPRLRRGRPAQRQAGRGAEPRAAHHRLRPLLRRSGRLLPGGERACRPRLARAHAAASAAASRS